MVLLIPIHGPAAQAQASPAEQEFLFAYKLMQRGDTAEAGEAFDAFLEKFPQDAQRGDALYFRAALYRQNGALRAAAELLAGATGRFAPKRVPAYAVQLLRGQVLTDLGEYEQAIASLEQVELDTLPDRAVASVRLLQALAYRGAGNFEASANAASAAASVSSPVKGRALIALARAQSRGGDNPAALETLSKTLAFDDAAVNAEAARLAGDLAYAEGNYDRAAEFYTRVIEREQSSPEFTPAVVGRMWADLQAGRNVAVISADKQFAESLMGGARASATYLAASAYQGLGQHALAAERLTQITIGAAAADLAEELRPLSLYKLAVSQFELARYTDMAKTVDTLEGRYPGVPQQIDASFLLASADAKQGRAAEGVVRLNAFIDDGSDNPYFAQALLRRAALYEQSGELSAASDDLIRYLNNTGVAWSASPTVALRYADISHRLGNYEQVINTTQMLLRAGDAPVSPAATQEALYRLGEAQTRGEQFREALATFDKLQQDHPINPYRHAVDLRRGLLLSKLGRPEESMAVLIAAADDPQLPSPQRVAALRIIAAQLRDDGRADDAATVLRRMENLAGLNTLSDNELLWLGDYEVQRDAPAAAIKTLAIFDDQTRKLQGVAESELLLTRGRAHFMLDDLENAHRSFFGVVALGRGFDLEARLFLARTEIARGNLDAALIELSDLTKADDGRIVAEALYEAGRAHRARATLLQRRGDAAGAAAQRRESRASIKRMVVLYLTVDALYPLQPQGLIALAEIAEALDEPEARDKELGELIRAFPDSPYADYAKALSDQLKRNRSDDALARLQRIDRDALDTVLRRWVDQKIAELEALR
ncbi:MAG: tetratricopeptide repeat protein [Planctomycetota bacterium]